MSFDELIRDGNKYYATIAVVCTIFVLIVLYLVWLDIKIKKIEDKNK